MLVVFFFSPPSAAAAASSESSAKQGRSHNSPLEIIRWYHGWNCKYSLRSWQLKFVIHFVTTDTIEILILKGWPLVFYWYATHTLLLLLLLPTSPLPSYHNGDLPFLKALLLLLRRLLRPAPSSSLDSTAYHTSNWKLWVSFSFFSPSSSSFHPFKNEMMLSKESF